MSDQKSEKSREWLRKPIRTSLTNRSSGRENCAHWSTLGISMALVIILTWFRNHKNRSKLTFSHFFGEPVNLSLGRTENDGLSDGKGIVEIAKCVEFPFFTFNSNKELFDTFQCQFITLDEDSDWIRHELVSHFQDFVWQSSRYQDNLNQIMNHRLYLRILYLSCWWEISVDVIDLFFETTIQHFIGFVKNEKLKSPIYSRVHRTVKCTLIFLVLRFLLLIISNVLPGVPTTTCWPKSNFLISSPTLVPPIQTWAWTFM